MMEDLLDKLQETNDRHKKLLLDEIMRLKAERDALKARIDKGVRVWARSGAFNGIWADTVNYADRRNATLILDEDARL